MLLIECPWCGPRAEIEFSYGGEGDIARPLETREAHRQGLGRLPVHAQEHAGLHREQWHHAQGCRRWFNAARDTVTYRFSVGLQDRRAPAQARQAEPADRCVERRAHQSRQTAELHVRRPHATRASGRHARLGAARQRRAPCRASFKYHRPRGIVTAGVGRTECAGPACVAIAHANAQCAGDRGRAVPGPGRHERERGRASTFRPWRSTRSFRASSPPGSTTRPSCGRAASGRSTRHAFGTPPVWARRPGSRSRPLRQALCALRRAGGGRRSLGSGCGADGRGQRRTGHSRRRAAELGGALLSNRVEHRRPTGAARGCRASTRAARTCPR